jgi:hypothetical protein
VLLGRFDRPEARLTVEPVTIQNALAVAGWVQGEMGGRALLERREGQWVLVLCAGDALLQPDMLHHAGLSEADAQRMAARIVAAEAQLPAARRELLARFDGIVRMDDVARPHP